MTKLRAFANGIEIEIPVVDGTSTCLTGTALNKDVLGLAKVRGKELAPASTAKVRQQTAGTSLEICLKAIANAENVC